MRGVTPALLIGLLITWAALPRATEAWGVDPPKGPGSSGPDFVQDIRPLLKTYCFECHNSTKRKAGLDLEQIDTAAAAIDLHRVVGPGRRAAARQGDAAGQEQAADRGRAASDCSRGSSTWRSRRWTTTSCRRSNSNRSWPPRPRAAG